MHRVIHAKRLFVVAAHPDDDTIGCGGTMAAIAASGGEIEVAYLTDGSRSHPGSRRFPPEDVAAIREREAVASLAQLGVRRAPIFFRTTDSLLGTLDRAAHAVLVDRLAEHLRSFGPDTVLAPWRRDPHGDHVAASTIAREALAAARVVARYAEYGVWLSINGVATDHPREGEAACESVALTPGALCAKRRALDAHRSQRTTLIDDDPAGFRITDELAERWLGPEERFFSPAEGTSEIC